MAAGNPQVCAFCARQKAQVRNLIAGDGLGHISVGICETCVGQSFDMLVASGALAPRTAAAPAATAAADPAMDAAIAILSAQLAVHELDLEALALLIEAYERTGNRAAAGQAREKAMKHIPVSSTYAKRIAAGHR